MFCFFSFTHQSSLRVSKQICFVFLSSSISSNHLLNVSTHRSESTCGKVHWLNDLESQTCLYKVSHMIMHISGKKNCLQYSQAGLYKYTNLETILVFLNFFSFLELKSRINDPIVWNPFSICEKVLEGQPSLQLYQSEFVSEGTDRRTTMQELLAWEISFSGLTNLKLSGLNSQHYVWRKPLQSTEPDCLRQCNDVFYSCGLRLEFLDCLVSGYY